MDTQTRAKKAAILKLMHGYPSSQSRITEEVVDAYLEGVAGFSPEAVMRACQRFGQGEVPGQSLDYLPSAASLAAQARLYDQIVGSAASDRAMARLTAYRQGELPPPGMEPAGITYIEVDGRRTDVRDWSNAEQDFALKTGKTPQSVLERAAPLAMPKLKGF